MSVEALERFRVPVPGVDPAAGGFFYVPEFVSRAEEALLLQKVYAAPRPKWKQLSNRRLQYWGGQLSEQSGALLAEPLPDFFVRTPDLVSRLRDSGAFAKSPHRAPNHCLVNEYLPGQGILPHQDGPAYFPVVATVSLGGTTLLDEYAWERDEADARASRPYPQEPAFSLFQEPRSLLVTTGSAYEQFLHGIAERAADEPAHLARIANVEQLADAQLREHCRAARRGGAEPLARAQRVSLTFRDVHRVRRMPKIG